MSDPFSDNQYWHLVNGPEASDIALAQFWDNYHKTYGPDRGPQSMDDIIERENRLPRENR